MNTVDIWKIVPNRLDQVFQSSEKMSSSSSAACEKYTCQICGYQARQKTHLNLHSQVAHGGSKYQCQECEYNTTQKSSFVSHQNSVHMGIKFQCSECEYESSWKQAIVSHQKSVHMGQKFQCPGSSGNSER